MIAERESSTKTLAALSLCSVKKPTCRHPGKTSLSVCESLDWEYNSLLPCPQSKSPSRRTQDELLFTDGSGKHPAEPTIGIVSVYRAELHAIMMACEMMDGPGVIVTDCRGAAVVANKLKAGLRRSC
eukprot:4995828-Amphidinium_carterae.1